MKVAQISHLNSLNVKVTEKIIDKNLKSFCENSLLINNISPKNHMIFFINYIQETSSYQLIYGLKTFKTTILNFIEEENFTQNSSKNTLLFNHTFFSIFKNQKLYYFQKLENFITKDELIEYIQTKLFIQIDDFIDILDDKIEEILSQKNISKTDKYSFIFYCIYLFLLLYVLFYILNKNDSPKEIPKPTISHPIFKPINYELSNILEKIKEKNLQIKEINIEDNLSKLVILAKNKKEIYEFLNEYKPYVISNNTNYREGENSYECHINFKNFR